MGNVVRLAQACVEPGAVYFNRSDLAHLLRLFSRHVLTQAWLDYSIDNHEHAAVFCVYRRAREAPLYKIVKLAAGSHRNGDYLVMRGAVKLRRAHCLSQALQIFDPPLHAVQP